MVFFWTETHYAESVNAIVREQFMDGVSVFARCRFVVGLSLALVPVTDHEEVPVFAETLLPHLLRSIASIAMTFFPLHAAFRSLQVVLWFLGFFEWTKAHMRCDDCSAI